jgi:hypothetical protein
LCVSISLLNQLFYYFISSEQLSHILCVVENEECVLTHN